MSNNRNNNIQPNDIVGNLPIELSLDQIASKLETADLLTARAVCNSWLTLFSDASIWKKKLLKEFGLKITLLASDAPNYQKIYLAIDKLRRSFSHNPKAEQIFKSLLSHIISNQDIFKAIISDDLSALEKDNRLIWIYIACETGCYHIPDTYFSQLTDQGTIEDQFITCVRLGLTNVARAMLHPKHDFKCIHKLIEDTDDCARVDIGAIAGQSGNKKLEKLLICDLYITKVLQQLTKEKLDVIEIGAICDEAQTNDKTHLQAVMSYVASNPGLFPQLSKSGMALLKKSFATNCHDGVNCKTARRNSNSF